MRRILPAIPSARLAGSLAAGVCVSVAVVIWFGWGALVERQRGEERLARRRARETVDLVVTALGRDMQGVQRLILSSWEDEPGRDPTDDVRSLAAGAFARYPYPESFFAWSSASAGAGVPFFIRSDRLPPFMPPGAGEDRFPVSVGYAPQAAQAIMARVRLDARSGRRFSIFETTLAGTRYQVVSRLAYSDAFRQQLASVIGFTVSPDWAREHYLPAVAAQVGRIASSVPFALVDGQGRVVAGRSGGSRDHAIRRTLPLLFFDPSLVAGTTSPGGVSREDWSVQADPGGDEALAAVARWVHRALMIAAAAAATLAFGLLLTVRAARESERVAVMRSEFVSAVTHELKTPIATIRVIGDTLVRNRVSEPAARHEYAQMLVQEAKRLTRLVDNLLAYARVTDAADVYVFEAIDVRAVVNGTVKGFRSQLADAGFHVDVDVPQDVPAVLADETALQLALDNVIHNAIRYSGSGRWLGVRARSRDDGQVAIEVSDHGVGIAADEIGEVTRRFHRGRRAASSGSGLGLAIVERIVSDHHGTLAIESEVGAGTTVRMVLPPATGAEEQP